MIESTKCIDLIMKREMNNFIVMGLHPNVRQLVASTCWLNTGV